MHGLNSTIYANKLMDDVVVNTVNKFDVFGMCETHCTDESDICLKSLNGYILKGFSEYYCNYCSKNC